VFFKIIQRFLPGDCRRSNFKGDPLEAFALLFRRWKRFFYFADRQAFLGVCVKERKRECGGDKRSASVAATRHEFRVYDPERFRKLSRDLREPRKKCAGSDAKRRYKSNYFTHCAAGIIHSHVFAIFKSPATPKPVSNWFRCQGLESHTTCTLCLCVCHCSRSAQCLLYHVRVAFECHVSMVTHVAVPVGSLHD